MAVKVGRQTHMHMHMGSHSQITEPTHLHLAGGLLLFDAGLESESTRPSEWSRPSQHRLVTSAVFWHAKGGRVLLRRGANSPTQNGSGGQAGRLEVVVVSQ
jgi:hypothetical protein